MSSSPALARSAAIVCRNLVREPSALLSIGRFEIVRTLGRGGHGIVYEAFDALRQQPVALKVLHGRGPSELYRLKNEFRSLAELRHRNLVVLHELSVEDDDAYFTMELVVGRDLLSYVHALGADAEARARDALAQLCEGIHALHCAGKLHRDLKPSNVLVDASGRVVLLDFGLACDALGEAQHPAGTLGYAAPEQTVGATCESSDWYSFGQIVRRVLDVLGAQDDTLVALEQLAERLQRSRPEERPGFAEILAVVSRPSAPPPPASLRAERHDRTTLIGRARELAELDDALARSRQQPVMVVVRGAPGIGKSALLSAFSQALSARAEDAPLILRGRCYEREAVPYKALDSMIDELSRVLLALPSEHPARALAPDASALLAVFPVLGRVPWLRAGADVAVDARPLELRARGFAALRALLAALAAERALVVCIDDLQWSDLDSGRLLGALLCEELSPRLLLVATDRSEASTAEQELQRMSELAPRPLHVEELVLGPLATAESLALAQLTEGALAAAHGADELSRMCAEARGNPRSLHELIRSADTRAHDGPHTLEALLARRLAALPEAGRAVLRLIAAAGRPLPARTIAAAAGLGVECHRHIATLRAAGLLRAALRGADEWLELEHDRVGEGALLDVDSATRRDLHARLVRALEAEPGAMNEALIDQYTGAGRPRDAARCAWHAADTASAALAFTRAARLYEQALSLGAFGNREAIELRRRQALALERSGRGLEAAAVFAAAAELSRDPREAATLDQCAADLWMRNGRYREGEAHLARGYRALGLRWPRGRLALLASIARLLLLAGLRRVALPSARAGETLYRARASFLAAAGSGIENYDLLRAFHNALLCFDQAERLADPVWQARVLGARAFIRSVFVGPRRSARALQVLERACTAAAQLGDIAARADLECQRAVGYYAADHPRRALEAAQNSEACLRVVAESSSDRNTVVSVIGATLWDVGRVKEARQCWNRLTHSARLHGDLMTMVWVHAHPTQLAVLFAYAERARATAILERVGSVRATNPRYPLVAWVHAAGCVEHAAFWGAPRDALGILERERKLLFNPWFPVMKAKARLIRARALLQAAAALPRGRARATLLRRAALDTAFLRLRGGPYNSGMACLLAAGVALLREQRGVAIARLDAADAFFTRCEAELLAQAARYCKGALLGGDCGAELQRRARAALDDQGVVDPPRYIAWLASGFGALIGRAS